MSDPRCTDVFARLSEYLDRELPDVSCEEIDKHIAGCEPCVQFLESLRQSIRLTHALEVDHDPTPLSPELKAELRRAFEAAIERRPKPFEE